MTNPRNAGIASIAVACLLATACGSSSDSPDTAAENTAPAAATPTASESPTETPAASRSPGITVKDFTFTVSGPVASGAKVAVLNNDAEAHTVTADGNGGFDITIQPGETETFAAPRKSGTFKFHCSLHGDMNSKLVVK